MKSAKLIKGHVEIIDVEKPVLEGNGAIIRVLGCGLCGSDIVKIRHSTPQNEARIVLGHEAVGVIEEIKDNETSLKVGDIVALGHHYPCLKETCEFCKNKSYSMCKTFKSSNITPGGFSEYIKVDSNHLKYTVYKMSDSLKEDEKAFLEPLSCCIRAVKRAGFEYDRDNSKYSSLVVGIGSIGLLMMKALKAFNVSAFGFDISKDRMDLAQKQGFSFDENKKYDVVFLTAGNSKAIETALNYVIDGGKIVVFSSIEDDLKGFSNNEIYYRELSVIASYSPSPADIKLSSELLNNKKVDVSNLSTYYKLDDLAQAIDDSNKILKAYIKI